MRPELSWLTQARSCRLSRAALPRRQGVVVASRPRFGSSGKDILKEGPGGKQIDGEAVQDTAQEYLQKVQVRPPARVQRWTHRPSAVPLTPCLAQNWWDGVEEKPAAVAIGVGALVVLWATSGLVDAIDKLPIIGGLLEVVGLIVTGWCVLWCLLSAVSPGQGPAPWLSCSPGHLRQVCVPLPLVRARQVGPTLLSCLLCSIAAWSS